eukprot:827752-Rhodomonas_salina.1
MICNTPVLTTHERERDVHGRYLHITCKPEGVAPAHGIPRMRPVGQQQGEKQNPAAYKCGRQSSAVLAA